MLDSYGNSLQDLLLQEALLSKESYVETESYGDLQEEEMLRWPKGGQRGETWQAAGNFCFSFALPQLRARKPSFAVGVFWAISSSGRRGLQIQLRSLVFIVRFHQISSQVT